MQFFFKKIQKTLFEYEDKHKGLLRLFDGGKAELSAAKQKFTNIEIVFDEPAENARELESRMQ